MKAWRPCLTEKRKSVFLDYLDDIWRGGQLTDGKYCRMLENAMARLFEAKYVVAVCNATVGLEVLLTYCKQNGKKTVVTQSLCYASDWLIPQRLGLDVKIADIREGTVVLDDAVDADVAVPVWLWGWHSKQYENELMSRYDFVISDLAHCVGSAKSVADGAVVSFQAVKILTGGEGGAVLTNDRDVYEYVRAYVNIGRREGRRAEIEGSNYKMNEVTAAFILSGMVDFHEVVGSLRWFYRRYVDELSCVENWKVFEPKVFDDWTFNGYLVPLVVDVEREVVEGRLLHDYGIETFAGYSRYVPTDEPAFHGTVVSDERGRWMSRHTVFLPSYYGMTEENLKYVCNAVLDLSKRLRK